MKTTKASCKLTSMHCKILEHIIVSTIMQRQQKKDGGIHVYATSCDVEREGILRSHTSLRRICILQQFKVQQKKYDNEEIKLGHEMLLVYKQYA